MGEVYAAEDPRLGRTVALKILPDAIASDPDRVRRFAREARAAAALNHPGIVTIYSVEEADGRSFITMELVEGRPLADLIPPAGLDIDRVLQLGAAVAEAVNVAHARAIVHRDLKPANVMITPDGSVKVLDFGLAKLQRQQTTDDDTTRIVSETTETSVVGTVSYMSPEQAEGKPIDHRSDIFSIGVMLYEMTTGLRPFQGDTPLSILSAILRESPRRLAEIRPLAPVEFERIVHRCLEKDRALRYQSAGDLAADLKHVRESARVQLPPRSGAPATPLSRRMSRRSLGAALAVIAVAAIALAAWKMSGRRPAAVTAEQISRITNDGTAAVAAISPDGRHIVHIKNIKGQPSLWVRQVTTQNELQIVPPAAVRYMGAAYSKDGNDVLYVTYPTGDTWGTLYRVSALGGQPQPVTRDVDSGVAVSPDGKRLAFVRYQLTRQGTRSQLLTVAADGTDERVVATRTTQLFASVSPSWSDDGTRILTAVRTQDAKLAIAIVTVATGEVRDVPGEWMSVGGFDWLADGQTFLVSATTALSQPAQLWQVGAVDGGRSRITTDLTYYGAVSISGDGRTMAAVQIEALASVFVARASSEVIRLTSGRAPDGIAGLTWTPDGRVIFSTVRGGKAQLFTVVPGQTAPQPLPSSLEAAGGPAIALGGKHLLFHGLDSVGWRIWLSGVGGESARPLSNGPNDYNPIVSRDGRWIYFTGVAGGLPAAYKTALAGGEITRLGQENFFPSDLLPDGQILGIAWLRDDSGVFSRTLAVLSPDGTIERRLTDVPLLDGPVVPFSLNPRVTPDGNAVSFVDRKDGVPNLWTKPIQGGTARRLTSFEDDEIFSFAWSSQGDLAVAKGHLASDVIVLTLGDAAKQVPRPETRQQ
jgi:Tol biopolymer transport system component